MMRKKKKSQSGGGGVTDIVERKTTRNEHVPGAIQKTNKRTIVEGRTEDQRKIEGKVKNNSKNIASIHVDPNVLQESLA